jgi:hypothetical protein
MTNPTSAQRREAGRRPIWRRPLAVASTLLLLTVSVGLIVLGMRANDSDRSAPAPSELRTPGGPPSATTPAARAAASRGGDSTTNSASAPLAPASAPAAGTDPFRAFIEDSKKRSPAPAAVTAPAARGEDPFKAVAEASKSRGAEVTKSPFGR